MRFNTLFFLLLAFSNYAKCQEIICLNPIPIKKAKIVILSEWHLLDIMPPYKRALIDRMHKEGLTDLILETGKATAYLLNEYVATGDTNILNNFVLFSKDTKDYWRQFRKYRTKQGVPIKIHGIDFERMSLVPALKRVFEKKKDTNNSLYLYLNSLPDTINNLYNYDEKIKERSTIIQKCLLLYSYNKKYYDSISDDKTYVIKEIIENPVLEEKWNERFDAMSHNLQFIYGKDTSKKYLLIVGMYHVDCKVPIFKNVAEKYNLSDNDIVNIALVIKDCWSEAMYHKAGKVNLASSESILAQPELIEYLYNFHVQPCKYGLVYIKNTPFDRDLGFKCEYIIPIDCKYDKIICK